MPGGGWMSLSMLILSACCTPASSQNMDVACFGTAPACSYGKDDPCPEGWTKINHNNGGPQTVALNGFQYSADCGSGCTSGWHVFCKRETACSHGGLEWAGTAPACNSHYADCFALQKTYLASKASHGDTWESDDCKASFGAGCTSGVKVLCKTPKVPVFQRESLDDNQQFKIGFWNIFSRPFIATHDGQYERQVQVPFKVGSWASGQLDAIVFDEAWYMYQEFYRLLTLVGFQYRCFSGASSPYNSFTGEPKGGIVIASRHPILGCKYTKFYTAPATDLATAPCHGADCLVEKGVLYAKVHKNSKVVYHIFGSHMQANYGYAERSPTYAEHDTNYHADRVRQAQIIKQAVSSANIDKEEPVLFAGDLNSDWIKKKTETEELMTKMGVSPIIPGNGEPACTYCIGNDLVQIDYPDLNASEYLDYIGVLPVYAQPATKTIEIMSGDKMELPTPLYESSTMEVCASSATPGYIPHNNFDCKVVKSIKSLSDHVPVMASLTYKGLEVKISNAKTASSVAALTFAFVSSLFSL